MCPIENYRKKLLRRSNRSDAAGNPRGFCNDLPIANLEYYEPRLTKKAGDRRPVIR